MFWSFEGFLRVFRGLVREKERKLKGRRKERNGGIKRKRGVERK